MARYVTDTHGLIWHLTSDPQLGANAARVLSEADKGLHTIFVPSIVLVETVYIGEKRKRGLTPQQVSQLLNTLTGSPTYVVEALELATVLEMQQIPRTAISDMPDRIITATARKLRLPLITRDQKIARSGLVQVLW